MTVYRSPTPEQWLRWAADKLGIDPVLFSERCDQFSLTIAIEAGYIPPSSDDRREEIAARLTNVLWRMLRRPPYKPAARELAIAFLEETAQLNGFRLMISDRQRAVLAQETGRALATHAKVQDWLAAHLTEHAAEQAQNAKIDVIRRFGPMHREPARMFVSCASHSSDEIPPDELADIFAATREAVQAAADASRPIWADGDDERVDDDDRPLLGAIVVSAPIDDHPWAKAPDLHCPTNRRTLWKANALVICGFGRGSHSTGCEHSEVPLSTPCLYVGRRDEPVPSAVAGALNLRQVDIQYFDDPGDVPHIVAWWTRCRWLDIERSQRLTEMRDYTFGRLANRFREAMAPLTAAQVAGVLRQSGLRPELQETLTSVHGLATMSVEGTQSAAAAFGFHAPSYMDSAGEAPLNNLQLDALSQFQAEYSLPASAANLMRREAERQQLLGVLRFSLTNLGEWKDFRDHLRHEAAG